ncbi:thiamine pyrophosphate-binding protein [Ottowia testudinis]|uniref:Thiamine pyrophosphate-binding protein n=1 Tax=Ottowia testudinis TaxID=2816950 RepID=A0A975H2A5_9BURK|nr:thiamine pyrophosphate-binding protein [Ottowia testudinis]QTD43981.1 thiamine pyrophosphate-binding protein [Ottowia testudinis]
MKKTAAQLAVYALEQLGITHTFGIPGVHNTELYDELANSSQITPLLVTHEGGGAFMADAFSRIHWGGAGAQGAARAIGTLVIVPAAGLTHAASGIGEAFLGGVPMLVITGGIRTDTPHRYKLHGVDQLEVAKGFTKAAFRVTSQDEVVATIYKAYEIATSGFPGPVLVEIPVNLQLFSAAVSEPPAWQPAPPAPPDASGIAQAAELLAGARQVGIFAGWGARHAQAQLIELAELLNAPVSTTLQGLAVFPADHPLHAGFGFSRAAAPAARHAFKGCDALLAVGTRFSEIPTGSFGAVVPAKLVHVDIDPEVFSANYPAQVAIEGDAGLVLTELLSKLKLLALTPPAQTAENTLKQQIARDKAAYRDEWLAHDSGTRVNPANFFAALREQMPAESITVLDDGNHTFLTAELYPQPRGAQLITPTDFNAMGYAVPAGIGAKLAAPHKEVAVIVGDGCFAMTCMELLTASANGLGVVFYVFNDGALSQIAQAQQRPYQRLTCTELGQSIDFAALAQATGAAYVALPDNASAAGAIAQARELAAQGRPVVVDVAIDYSKPTAFTRGVTDSNFKTFPLGQKLRFVKRMVGRRFFS